MPNIKSKKKYNTRNQKKIKLSKGNNESSDEDDSSQSVSESEYSDPDYDPENDELLDEVMDEEEFQQFIYQLFPSKHQKKKAENAKKVKKSKKQEETEEEDDDESSEYEDDDSEYEFEDDEEMGNINIILTINNPLEHEEYDFEDEDEDEYEDEDEDEYEDEDEHEDEDEDEDEIKPRSKKVLSKSRSKTKERRNSSKDTVKKESSKNKSKKSEKTEKSEKSEKSEKKEKSEKYEKYEKKKKSDLEKEKEILDEIEKATAAFLAKNKDSEILTELKAFSSEKRKEFEKSQKKHEKKEKRQNTEKFKTLLNEKKTTNELNYFYGLSLEKQKVMIKSMEDLNKAQKITIPYRFKLLEMELPESIKALAMRKVNVLRTMDASSGEYNKIKNWMDAFMSIPFNTYKKLNISMEDGEEKCQKYMSNAMGILDNCVYGLDDAKMQIIQMIGTWIANPDAVGNAVAIKGPPGTGKTTLVKEGISKILERPFEFIALGGSTDSSFLEGHSYTYEGSTWGKIASILMKSKCMNPIIYFDELDKVSETPKGEEIIGILTHLIDTSQNTQFHDKYFADIDFDLSKCLFIFSYNDENKVNPILRDRMYKIETKGYDGPQKLVITKDYLLPNIRKMINFKPEDIVLDDDAINYIISQYTDSEKGVRNLKRCLEILYTKLNLYRLTNGNIDESIQKNLKLKEVSFPYTVTRECIETLIKPKEMNQAMLSLYS